MPLLNLKNARYVLVNVLCFICVVLLSYLSGYLLIRDIIRLRRWRDIIHTVTSAGDVAGVSPLLSNGDHPTS
jgi:hypothetical protein